MAVQTAIRTLSSRQSIFPNNYHFRILDPDWGPEFIKTIAYAPFSVWVYLNGNEWAKT